MPQQELYPNRLEDSPGIIVAYDVGTEAGAKGLMDVITGYRSLQLYRFEPLMWVAILQPGGASTLERPA